MKMSPHSSSPFGSSGSFQTREAFYCRLVLCRPLRKGQSTEKDFFSHRSSVVVPRQSVLPRVVVVGGDPDDASGRVGAVHRRRRGRRRHRRRHQDGGADVAEGVGGVEPAPAAADEGAAAVAGGGAVGTPAVAAGVLRGNEKNH